MGITAIRPQIVPENGLSPVRGNKLCPPGNAARVAAWLGHRNRIFRRLMRSFSNLGSIVIQAIATCSSHLHNLFPHKQTTLVMMILDKLFCKTFLYYSVCKALALSDDGRTVYTLLSHFNFAMETSKCKHEGSWSEVLSLSCKVLTQFTLVLNNCSDNRK